MEKRSHDTKSPSTYPGDYVPMFTEEELENELKHTHLGLCLNPPINVIETSRYFSVEVAVPGVSRENFLIQTEENKVIVSLLQKNCDEENHTDFQLHEFNYSCFKRTIVFPDEADLDFLKAEYKNGMLLLYIPKTDKPLQRQHASIAVY